MTYKEDESRPCVRCGKKYTKLDKQWVFYKGHATRSDGTIKERICIKCKKIRDSEYGRARYARIRKDYYGKPGISLEVYNKILLSQNGVCAICKSAVIPKRMRYMCIDHDHVTGKIRGILCSRCNSGLGLLMDSITNLESAIQYLKKTNI